MSATRWPAMAPSTLANACSMSHGIVGARSFNVAASAGSPSALT
jgi:hypothetical protein